MAFHILWVCFSDHLHDVFRQKFIIINLMKSRDYSRGNLQRFNERLLFPSISAKLIPQAPQAPLLLQQKVQVSISQIHLQEQARIYEWRVKTEFPIVKIYDYRIVGREGGKVIVAVRSESYPIKLTELNEVPLFKILYLLKEAIIGFQRLFFKFGAFLVTAKMIALNSHNKCKIWLNENFASNAFVPCQMEEKLFLQTIYKIFVEAGNKLKNTLHFFKEIIRFGTFCQALNFIENYARQNKISIPTSCKIAQKEISLAESKSNNTFNPSLTMTRAPKFLNSTNLRSSLKSSSKQEFDKVFKKACIPKIQPDNFSNTIQLTETVQMKTSGDTAADIYGSGSLINSIQEEKEVFDQSIIFGEVQKVTFKIPQSPLTFSKIGKRQLTSTKQINVNENTDMNGFFGSTKYSTQMDINPTRNFKSYREIQTEQDQHENLEASTKLLASIFQKNKWEKTLCGLFSEGGDDMKKSTQHGVQKHRTYNSQKRLYLLQSVSKDLHESFINQEH